MLLVESPMSLRITLAQAMTNSAIPAIFEGNPPLDGWLLGDNGYPLNTWLMTTCIMPATVREIQLNRKHSLKHTV